MKSDVHKLEVSSVNQKACQNIHGCERDDEVEKVYIWFYIHKLENVFFKGTIVALHTLCTLVHMADRHFLCIF